MEKDSEINHEKIVENLSIQSNEIENVENNQNVLNYDIRLKQLEDQKDTIIQETLVTETSLEEHLDNINMISEEDKIRQPQNDTKSDVENEDELNFHRQKNKKSKFSAILDSDSENEENSCHILQKNDEISSELEIHELEKDSKNDESEIQNKKPRRIAIIDSDSDDCMSNTSGKSLKKNVEENENAHSFQTDQRKILSALCDSDSSDDNSNENEQLDENTAQISDNEMEALQGNVVLANKSRRSKSKKINGEKQEKMTAKKALEQRKEIFSESQRKIRESRVSLPYHKPKQRSLKEFLENRPKLSSALTNIHNAASPSTAIKMSIEQLEIVSKKLKEREKEVQQFYKSESESESEDLPIDSANTHTNVLTQETNISTEINTFQAETDEKTTNIEINNMLESNSNNDNICGDNSDTDILLQESDSSNINPSQYEIMENNRSSEIDQVHQNDYNDNCANAETRENIGKSETNSSVSIQNCNENIGITHVALNLNETSDIVSNFQNSEEVNHLNNANQNNNLDESKQKLIDTSDQKSTSFYSMEHGEQTNIHLDVKKTSVENKFTDEAENEFMVVNSVDTTEIKKIPDLHESFKPLNSDESRKVDKLIILSDVVVKRSHSNKSENIYNLDSESLDVGSDVKDNTYESENYDFNLDDLNDEFECDNNGQIEKSKVEDTNEKKCQLPKRRQELLEKLGSLKPRLSCGPNELIDLENGLTLPDEISKLRERFLQHNIKIGKHKHKKEISILSVTDGKIQTETLALNVDEDDEENTAPLEKPGVRLQKLREELEHQMAKRRSDMWKEKLDQTNRYKEENDEKSDAEDEKSASGIDNILDNDEEEEFTESEVEDEELEEDDYDMSDKAKKKSLFIDEEAEESDVEEEVEETQLKESSEEVDMNQEDADTKDDEEMEELENEVPKKKVLKRIITSLDNDDSDNEDLVPHNKMRFPFSCGNKEKKVSSDEECLSPHQPTNYKIKELIVTPTKSENDFLTPITYMTGIQNLNTSGSRIVAPINSSPEKQLSDESGLESQGFYGNFPNTQVLISSRAGTEEVSPTDFSSQAEHNILSTQDVLDVCSGSFPTSTQATSDPEMSTQQLKEIFTGVEGISQKSDFNTQQLADICSGQFTGVPQFEKSSRGEIALDESEENIISQLIDEEELERFKKKFESPVASYTQKTIDFENVKEVEGTGGIIDSEDDDELHLKKKKNKRLNFSDEESDEYSEEEEIIDLHDKDPASDVEYDSEENEIDLGSKDVDNKTNKQEKIKITDFLENEAELSESEWGSEDEDEKNLDDMEFEKGDEEKFDEELLRSDIERVQMRQMLDEDNREVKLLQELLLEDGELHGSGRQRQFRWKNIDATGNDMEETKLDDGDTYHDEEEESEEKWRKMRHEREMFMLKKQSQEEDDNVLIESQKLSFTHKSLKIKNQTAILSHTMSEEVTSSSKINQPFSLLNKRGSFLSRSEQILQKFAETTKVSIGPKSSSRIVFQTVDGEMKKRKAASQDNDCTPVALKKLRLSDLSPALQKIRPKLGKTLFEDLSID